MDRMEEYKALMAELENEPETLTGCVARVAKRARRERVRRRITQSAAGFGMLAACFVLAVNLCTPIALACGKVPILRELAQAVIVSPSLSAAVANEHVQLIEQEQTVNGYTVRLEYVIADKKQVNMFYTVEGEPPEGDRFSVMLDVITPSAPDCSIVGGLTEPGEMDYMVINFVEGSTPEHLDLRVKVDDAMGEVDRLATCDFSLDLDPYLLSHGRTVEVNEEFALDGNTLTLSTVEIYPTHMRVNVEQDAENADYLKALTLTIDGDGRGVERLDNKGLSSTGGGKYGTYSVYTASSWYYGCDELTLTIGGAVWLDRERLETVVDLTAETATGLPDGVEFTGVVSEDDPYYSESDGIALGFACTDSPYFSPFGWDFKDEEGNLRSCGGISIGAAEGSDVHYHLGDYRGDMVILENDYSCVAEYDEPLVLTVDVSE